MLQIVTSVTDNSRGIIYNSNIFYKTGHRVEIANNYYKYKTMKLITTIKKSLLCGPLGQPSQMVRSNYPRSSTIIFLQP